MAFASLRECVLKCLSAKRAGDLKGELAHIPFIPGELATNQAATARALSILDALAKSR